MSSFRLELIFTPSGVCRTLVPVFAHGEENGGTGVTVFQGEARLLGPHLITVNDRSMQAADLVIATGTGAREETGTAYQTIALFGDGRVHAFDSESWKTTDRDSAAAEIEARRWLASDSSSPLGTTAKRCWHLVTSGASTH